MCKKWIVAAVMIALLVAATPAQAGLGDYIGDLLGLESAPQAEAPVPQHMALWLLGTPTKLDNPDAELSARLGWRNDDTEFGAEFNAIGIHGENHESFGMYGIMWITDTEYLGYHGSIMEENISYGPFAGTVLAGIITEYRYRSFSGDSPLDDNDDHQLYMGLKLEF